MIFVFRFVQAVATPAAGRPAQSAAAQLVPAVGQQSRLPPDGAKGAGAD